MFWLQEVSDRFYRRAIMMQRGLARLADRIFTGEVVVLLTVC